MNQRYEAGFLAHISGMNYELTVVVLCGEEPDERRDALAVLRVVEVVAPAVEGAILLRVVAREGVLVP